MLTDEQKARADQILADLMSLVRESCDEEIERLRSIIELHQRLNSAVRESRDEEIERLRLAIEMHQRHSLQMVKDDPKIRLSAADYELWEVLGEE
jgi:hypothetical protein